MSLSTRKVGSVNVSGMHCTSSRLRIPRELNDARLNRNPAIGYGAMGIGGIYGQAGNDEERFKVS